MKQENRLRRPAFDREAGVAIAQVLFHEHGYDAVSIADLTQALNIKPPSIQVPDCSTIIIVGPYKTTVKRDVKQSKSGKSPTFQIRIAPELKAQFEVAAKEAGISLGNWLKKLGQRELELLGVEVKK